LTTSTQISTCTSTFTTGTSTVDYTPQYIELIQQFSSMNYTLTGTENGQGVSTSVSYTTTSPQPGIYNVTVPLVFSGTKVSYSFLVDSNNNTVLAYALAGMKMPSSSAKQSFDGVMSVFGTYYTYSNNLGFYESSQYFTNEGTTTKTFGTVSFPVTTYVAKSSNEAFSYCGFSGSITSYTLEVGTPPGTSLPFVVYVNFAGTENGYSVNVTLQLISMTIRG